MKRMPIIAISTILLFVISSVKGQVIVDSTSQNCTSHKSFTSGILNEFKNRYLSQVEPYRIVDNLNSVTGVIVFLNNDFETNIFSQFCFFKSSNFQIISNERTLHLATVEIGFNSSVECSHAWNLIEQKRRKNFNIEVLTKFILLKKDNNLVFIFSETPNDKIINSFFKHVMHVGLIF